MSLRLPVQWIILFLFTLLLGFISLANAQSKNTRVHDPVMIQQNGTYYLFSTGRGISVQSSDNLKDWTREKPVFESAPGWTSKTHPNFRNHIWAPDIAEHNGTYYLYYSISNFGTNNSAIGVATNQTLDPNAPNFEWKDHGFVVRSVPGRDMWNAIDPNLTFDNSGTPWLTFGSYWLGIKIVKLKKDDLTEIASSPKSWQTIASRHRYWKLDERDAGNSSNGDIEAPFIFKKYNYYYLFASWDQCCSGNESTYKIVVGRSKDITGPYFDRAGKKMIHGGGSLVAKGNDQWTAVGHNAAYTFDGTDYLVFHGYDKSDEGNSKLIIKEINWQDGWPTIDF
ncbi:arabinan endo-1,5-alpha-L-arabinosidase [Aliifodinibius salipaludis]|uniref:Arabinan endo-1,5-alpha-L-arabinosidase n=1 Tax=Fodinibius salipaludis TaxID=2032627 RepID=A0A2A2GFU9_9BACT|nr:arabinan endo-1,5-alpha-L-arabinosidase [Aliifodinibius salipaludis]PAU95864.1 arabinan endo-1,5-alpha-L-arabinosidase [Aliifodinibius salipaludis]